VFGNGQSLGVSREGEPPEHRISSGVDFGYTQKNIRTDVQTSAVGAPGKKQWARVNRDRSDHIAGNGVDYLNLTNVEVIDGYIQSPVIRRHSNVIRRAAKRYSPGNGTAGNINRAHLSYTEV